jgi:chorismate-pyruvate lyase
MFVDFVPLDVLLSTSGWLTSDELTTAVILPSTKAALETAGLLTTALANAYGTPVTVEVLRQSEWSDARGILGLRRDVLLRAGETPCVAASTLMPSTVIEAHPWLAALGGNALGETLEKRVTHRRGEYEYKKFDANRILPPASESPQFTWIRRYRFTLEGGDLLVTETFFPGVLNRLTPK